jgi:hypothetical protein
MVLVDPLIFAVFVAKDRFVIVALQESAERTKTRRASWW